MARLRTESSGNDSGAKSKRAKPRVTIYRNDDGTYDFSSMSDDDRAKLFNGNPAAAPPPPPDAAPPPPPSDPIDPAIVGMLLNVIVAIESQVVASKLKLPPDKVAAALTPGPPFDTKITELAARVMDKHGATMGKWGDEIALGLLLITWQTMAFSQIRAIAAEQAAKTTEAAPPHVDADRHASPPSAPPPPPPPPQAKTAQSLELMLATEGVF